MNNTLKAIWTIIKGLGIILVSSAFFYGSVEEVMKGTDSTIYAVVMVMWAGIWGLAVLSGIKDVFTGIKNAFESLK